MPHKTIVDDVNCVNITKIKKKIVKKCEHGKCKYYCKECGGKGLCKHGKYKKNCKKCGGSGICEHKKHKRFCKECGGKGFCEHGKHKQFCKDCGGKGICKHERQKYLCKECGGKGICKHGERKYRCKNCYTGKEFYEHDAHRNNHNMYQIARDIEHEKCDAQNNTSKIGKMALNFIGN